MIHSVARAIEYNKTQRSEFHNHLHLDKNKQHICYLFIYFQERTPITFLEVRWYFPNTCGLINGVFLDTGRGGCGQWNSAAAGNRQRYASERPSVPIPYCLRKRGQELSHWPRRTAVRILPAEEERQASASAKNPGGRFHSFISVTSAMHVYNTSLFRD